VPSRKYMVLPCTRAAAGQKSSTKVLKPVAGFQL
jgi:hypothetical protein